MLDSAGLGFVNKIGGSVVKLGKDVASDLSGKYDEIIGQQSDPDPPGEVYQHHYGWLLNEAADNMAKHPNSWQSDKYAFCTSAEGCYQTLSQITENCIDYYDNHKMSKSNATKVCTGFQNTLTTAAAFKAKRIAALTQLSLISEARVVAWAKNDWQWRQPKTYVPSGFASAAGYIYDLTKNGVRHSWGGVFGFGAEEKNKSNDDKGKPSSGLFATSESLIAEVGYDAEKALNLAYAGALDPLRDELRAMWKKNRKGYGVYQLREWYSTPQDSYVYQGITYYKSPSTYDCPKYLAKTCAAAIEAKFDKVCYPPLSELYITEPYVIVKGKIGNTFMSRYLQKASACKGKLSPIIAAAKKLAAAEPGIIAGLCTPVLEKQKTDCTQQLSDLYEACAIDELKAGNDDAAECFGIYYELFAHPGASNKSPTNPSDIPEKKKKSPSVGRTPSAPIIDNTQLAAPQPEQTEPQIIKKKRHSDSRLPSAPVIDNTQLAAPEPEQAEPQILEPIKPIQREPAPIAAKSTLCQFTTGPRAGQVQDYAPMAPIPVGSNCQDARGSYGTVIAE